MFSSSTPEAVARRTPFCVKSRTSPLRIVMLCCVPSTRIPSVPLGPP